MVHDPTSRLRHFLDCYARKDLPALSRMLAEDVSLRDWNVSVHGRAAAEAEMQRNFDDARSIAIEVLRVYANADGVAGELRITVDGTIELHVVDVMQFDADGRICAIRSYKGRAD